ncbi:hypothetical protein LWI28_026629 [Acer negundo]|uniref:Uncharacterized protein n=1 Tax=Acer negundo TaxID=4023 RepID=A0AAD5NYQ6_ACENE|nr:hypothetical protein LWI28_026629 [Acer negundo]
MGKAKKCGTSNPTKAIDKSKPSFSSKKSKADKLKQLGIFGDKKLILEKGVGNETMVRELYCKLENSTTFQNALLDIRDVVFRVNAWKLNEFLGLSNDIESDFLDVGVLEKLDLMGKTLCDNVDLSGESVFLLSKVG